MGGRRLTQHEEEEQERARNSIGLVLCMVLALGLGLGLGVKPDGGTPESALERMLRGLNVSAGINPFSVKGQDAAGSAAHLSKGRVPDCSQQPTPAVPPGPGAPSCGSRPADVVFIIDSSGSMTNYLDAASRVFGDIMNSFSDAQLDGRFPAVRVSVMCFDEDAFVVLPFERTQYSWRLRSFTPACRVGRGTIFVGPSMVANSLLAASLRDRVINNPTAPQPAQLIFYITDAGFQYEADILQTFGLTWAQEATGAQLALACINGYLDWFYPVRDAVAALRQLAPAGHAAGGEHRRGAGVLSGRHGGVVREAGRPAAVGDPERHAVAEPQPDSHPDGLVVPHVHGHPHVQPDGDPHGLAHPVGDEQPHRVGVGDGHSHRQRVDLVHRVPPSHVRRRAGASPNRGCAARRGLLCERWGQGQLRDRLPVRRRHRQCHRQRGGCVGGGRARRCMRR